MKRALAIGAALAIAASAAAQVTVPQFILPDSNQLSEDARVVLKRMAAAAAAIWPLVLSGPSAFAAMEAIVANVGKPFGDWRDRIGQLRILAGNPEAVPLQAVDEFV